MNKTDMFTFDKSCSHTSSYFIRPTESFYMIFRKTNGSFNLAPARVMGLSYADYLRFCRDAYGAIIAGKNELYPIAYFSDSKRCKDLVTFLNSRMEELFTKKFLPIGTSFASFIEQKTEEFEKECEDRYTTLGIPSTDD